jgi:hypothetical protein
MLLITVARADERLKVNNTFVLFLPQSVSAISSARSGNGISFEKRSQQCWESWKM